MVKSASSIVPTDTKIEDIIEARKNEGQYDVYTQVTNFCRYAYSAPSATVNDLRIERNYCNLWMSDGELNNHHFDVNSLNVGPTDSEITVVRVKREGLQFKTDRNNWDMHDDAIPGDGTHLGESPSLVNLVTLVAGQPQNGPNSPVVCSRDEYLVPLSSWDPSDNPHDYQEDIQATMEADCAVLKTTISRQNVRDAPLQVIKAPATANCKRDGSLARRIVRFFRLRLGRLKPLPAQGQESEVSTSIDKM